MTVDTFDGLTPTHAMEDDPAVLVGVDCPRGDSDRAYMVGTWLGRAHLTCTAGGHVWIEDAPTGTCDLGIGGGLHCGRPWGHDAFCAVSGDAGFTDAAFPLVMLAVFVLGPILVIIPEAVFEGILYAALVWLYWRLISIPRPTPLPDEMLGPDEPTAVGMVGLVGWLAFGRSWVREGA